MAGMRSIQIIKVKNIAPDLEFIEDRAVADFRSFHAMASLHVRRVQTPYAINQMLDVLESLQNSLHEKRLMLL